MRFRFVPGSESTGSQAIVLRHSLWVGETEVTRGQWHKLMGKRPGNYLACGDDCPVEMINWYEALAFANALSKRSDLSQCYRLAGCEGELGEEGPYGNMVGMVCESAELVDGGCAGYRLPTEKEWEISARSGTSTSIYSGEIVIKEPLTTCGGPDLDSIAWYHCTGDETSHPVGTKAPNDWQLYDMIGNVSEWVWDCYSEENCERRTVKGCSVSSQAQYCHVAFRLGLPPDMRVSIDGGLRLVRTADGTQLAFVAQTRWISAHPGCPLSRRSQ
ncbi:MAG: formylglycine-generating enzyme family protein [bacterium]|nr:formylglycine-generating enzyme family protein [bacterium]